MLQKRSGNDQRGGGAKIGVNQGTLEDKKIIIQTNGHKEVFAAITKIAIHKNSTAPQHAPRWLFYSSSPTSLET